MKKRKKEGKDGDGTVKSRELKEEYPGDRDKEQEIGKMGITTEHEKSKDENTSL